MKQIYLEWRDNDLILHKEYMDEAIFKASKKQYLKLIKHSEKMISQYFKVNGYYLTCVMIVPYIRIQYVENGEIKGNWYWMDYVENLRRNAKSSRRKLK
mgnify:CR=1 FL=1